jgi:glucosamine 6-phosphate synthetase-like amidotransferase/phosphosugar isomerase protein
MCGLTGALLYPRKRTAEEWQDIIDITTANLVFNEERGRDAAGIAVIRVDGGCRIFKQPVSASTLCEMPGYRALISSVDDRTVCILGHTRMPTKGSRWRNVNNHPLRAGHVVGVHNGVITNDDALFERRGFPRAGEVDSEIIFRLLDAVGPEAPDKVYTDMMRRQVDALEGTFASLSVDLRRPTVMMALKHLRPLCLHYHAQWDTLFFSSRYIFLRKAFGRSVITEALDSGHGFYFDAQKLPEKGCEPVFSFDVHGEFVGQEI